MIAPPFTARCSIVQRAFKATTLAMCWRSGSGGGRGRRRLRGLGSRGQKAGLVGLADDDRAALDVALLDCTARVQGDDAGNVLALWKRRGKRAFDAEAEGAGNG